MEFASISASHLIYWRLHPCSVDMTGGVLLVSESFDDLLCVCMELIELMRGEWGSADRDGGTDD